jgi:D-alanyl-D-alanine carboxypeptidase
MRSIKAIKLLEQGFSGSNLTWLRPALGTVDHLVPIDAAPPDLRDEVCGPKRKRPASDDPGEDTIASSDANSALTFFAAGLKPPALRPEDMLAAAPAPAEPVVVYTGPTKTGADLIAAVAADTASQTPVHAKRTRAARGKHGAKSHTAEAKGGAKSGAKHGTRVTVVVDTKGKPSGSKPAASAKSSDKPAADAKPAGKPKAAAKPAAKPAPKHSAAETKPAAKPKSASAVRN